MKRAYIINGRHNEILKEWNDTHSRVGQLKLFFKTYSTDIYVNMYIQIFNKYLLRIWYIIMDYLGRLLMLKDCSTARDTLRRQA